MAFRHHLSLKCTYRRRDKFSSDAKLVELHNMFEESEASLHAAEEKIKQLEAKLEDQSFKSQVKIETARTIALEAGKIEGFSVGRATGARDFLKSHAFWVALEIKAIDFLDRGFERCMSQVKNLTGFAKGFDMS
ncbi:hypothetical protein Salat_2523800 [Sesamum alatum]|uniref:Uncharacterized protein n=1 Tax=Sesamum alatum TaxID=300844 RepID=A0AAE1XSW9_9LAMI|nr:hypothetical protein Salat_2523800 [Sesamum alatum]